MKIYSGREVCRILERRGFTEVRRRGSHIVMQRRATDGTITVVVPNHNEVRRGTLSSIIRQSRLDRREFEESGL